MGHQQKHKIFFILYEDTFYVLYKIGDKYMKQSKKHGTKRKRSEDRLCYVAPKINLKKYHIFLE